MLDDLRQHLFNRLPHLAGDWVGPKSGYEPRLCAALQFTEQPKKRYWDASWNAQLFEFKKGKSIWLDLVRYSEIMLKKNEDAARETSTLFFIPGSPDRIVEVVCVPTARLVERLLATSQIGEFLVDLNDRVPRSLNAQGKPYSKRRAETQLVHGIGLVSLDDLLA
jgi:hypothetical protein